MNVYEEILSCDEQAVFRLRALYQKAGYKKYRMSKFEPYDLYAENKSFLPSDNIITFTDLTGQLLALKPDVTLSIAKNIADNDAFDEKVYYNENVYRIAPGCQEYKEIMQVGVENIGAVNLDVICEVIMLAAQSLQLLSGDSVVDVSHLGLVSGLLDETGLSAADNERLLKLISRKSRHELSDFCALCGVPQQIADALTQLVTLYGDCESVLKVAAMLDVNEQTHAAISELTQLYEKLRAAGYESQVKLDFSLINNMNYYDGVIFQGFLSGVQQAILSGGSYGKLLRKLGKKVDAIGFAVYLDQLAVRRPLPPPDAGAVAKPVIDVALPKGRLGEKAYDIFERAGYGCAAIHETSRKLLFENERLGVRYFWAKPSDVAIYVERGAADLGVVGKDILREYKPDLYELLDLGLGKCRMAVAGPRDFCDDLDRTLRVATKFPNTARDYYRRLSRDVDIIMLNGSIELAPILNMSDVIVDIVETGSTLKENDLAVLAEIAPVSARLIANKASYKFKHGEVTRLTQSLAALL